MARLIVKTDGGENTVDLSPSKPVSVGRDAANQVPLADVPGVSRVHCRITAVQAGGGLAWEVTDLGATNKTRVNGKITDKRVLSSGDVIKVGKAELTFEDPQEEERLRAAGAKGVCLLEWVSGERKGEKVMLDAPRTTLGRRPSNTIQLDDRMSSSHHAEIAKDLNGYTIRDMGSTNGTLVNGEPLTEAPLNHGARIRIGNSRFVFKDPSMKDIEVELSQFDEDEGWGMMGDIDLSRARGSYIGLLLGLLLLAGAGGAAFFLMQEAEKNAGGGGVEGDTNLVQNGDMEDAGQAAFLWTTPNEDDPVSISTRKRGAGSALSLRHTGAEEDPRPVVVSYADEFPALKTEPLRIRADVRATGAASLVALWRNEPNASAGATAVTHTIPLGTGAVDVVAAKPPWADIVSIGVRLEPGSSAVLDDLRVTRVSGGDVAAAPIDCPGDPNAWLHPTGGLDIVNTRTVLVFGAQPVARMPDGAVLSHFVPAGPPTGGRVEGTLTDGEKEAQAQIAWSKSERGDGLQASITCAGAAAVGLDAKLLRAHVSDGLNVLTRDGPRGMAAAAGQQMERVRQTLAGDPQSTGGRPRTLVTFAPGGDGTANTVEVLEAADPSALLLRHLTEGTEAEIVLVTDYEVQSRAAQDAFAEAESLTGRLPGRAIKMLRAVAVLYPFNERVRDSATAAADRAESDARKEIAAFEEALQAFRVFRSDETLERVDKLGEALATRYPAGEAMGPLETRVAELQAEAEMARDAYHAEHAGAELSRLEKLADLLAEESGYQPMAAIFYRTIVDRFGHLEGDDAFGRRVARARQRLEELMKKPEIAEAVPR
jgi:pSer/pThr/pTyr-binding forkhead associated (FHA) protein